jgi:2-methylfumaryl-CoA isomerase
LFPLFEKAIAARDLATLATALEAAGVTWSVYQTMNQAVREDARLFTNNPIFQTLATNPSGLNYPVSGPAGTVTTASRGTYSPAPRLGQHTDEVLATVLGLGSGQIAKLHDAGIVAGPGKL